MRNVYPSFLLLLISVTGFSQRQDIPAENIELINFEKQIDSAVVTADIAFLKNAYADDFRFKHGTGHVDDKTSWLTDVERNRGLMISRMLDSVEVEIHQNVGITNGRLTVRRKNGIYALKYVRVYVKRNNQWQMIMHRTVAMFR